MNKLAFVLLAMFASCATGIPTFAKTPKTHPEVVHELLAKRSKSFVEMTSVSGVEIVMTRVAVWNGEETNDEVPAKNATVSLAVVLYTHFDIFPKNVSVNRAWIIRGWYDRGRSWELQPKEIDIFVSDDRKPQTRGYKADGGPSLKVGDKIDILVEIVDTKSGEVRYVRKYNHEVT